MAAEPLVGLHRDRWLTPGVADIGCASLLADIGHEIPTALLPSFLSSTLGVPASALGLIEGPPPSPHSPRVDARGSAFGLLATVQSLGNFAARAGVGLIRAAVSSPAAFACLVVLMIESLLAFSATVFAARNGKSS